MRQPKYESGYFVRLEIGFLAVIIAFVVIFYCFPEISSITNSTIDIIEPDFVIVDIPRTFYLNKIKKPTIPVISSQYEEFDLMGDVEIVNHSTPDSTQIYDSTFVDLLYYDDFLPYSAIDEFDPESLKEKKEPLDYYHDYLFEKLAEIDKHKNTFKIRSNVDDFLVQSMGRDPNMLTVNIGNVVDETKKYIVSNKKNSITIHNIVETEKDWYLLEVLWQKKTHSIFEIYNDDSVKNQNTILSLKKSIENLKNNGLVFEIEIYNTTHYSPTFKPDQMIEIVNKLLVQDLTTQQKTKLSSFLNFIVLNS